MEVKKFDSVWEKIHSSQEWGKYPSEHVVRFTMRHYKQMTDRSRIRILDIGCGGGANTWFFAKEGFNVYAFDGSASAVKNTQKYLEKNGLSAKLDVFPAADMYYPKGYFDFILDNASLCVCGGRSMIQEVYNKIFTLLKPQGYFMTVGFTMNCSGAGEGIYLEENTYKGELCGNGGQMHYTSKNEMIEMLNMAGFSDITINTDNYTDGERVVDMVIADCKKG